MKFLQRFFDGIQRDIRLFVFILLILQIYRVAFIAMMSEYIEPTTTLDQITLSLWTGLRLSLKTAGAVTLLSFVLATVLGIGKRLRLWIGIAASFIFAVLFMARFPYYETFNATFGIEVLRGLNDDLMSVIAMILQEYGFLWRFPVALLLTLICVAILSRLLRMRTIQLPNLFHSSEKFIVATILFVITGAFGMFIRFGGSFTYASGINWENSAVTTDEFLNECILDDGQAMYRVRSIAKNMSVGTIWGVDESKVVEYAQFITGKQDLNADSLKPYLERTAEGARIEKPQHIFIILGESWMQWPLLGKYSNLHVADGLKSVIAQPNSYYTRNFMPNGDFTSAAITGLVTGLPDIDVYVNYDIRTYSEIYLSAMSTPFKELGYNVDFWYGGTPSWDNVSKLALAQGFDNFYGYPDLDAPKQTTWGAKDSDLFKAIRSHLPKEPPTIHLIMTTTNHPPYNLDLEAEGYDFDAVLKEVEKLPNVSNAEVLTTELGHYWYMDKVTTNFVCDVAFEYPSSLFVITGDHAVRTDPSTHPTLFEHQSVPLVIYGNGIDKKILPSDAVGGHTSIVPTLIELIAPEGFKYYSIAPSLFESVGVAFNRDVYLTQSTIGEIEGDVVDILPHVPSANLQKINMSADREKASEVISAMRTVAWQMIVKGDSLKE